jgi:hypothetical protein
MAFSRRDSYPGGISADFGPRANAFRPLAEKSHDDAASAVAQTEAHERLLAHLRQLEDTKARWFFFGVTTAYGILILVGSMAWWLRAHP